MFNQFLVMGRLTENPRENFTPSGTKVVQISVACQREFRNSNGEYATDFFNIEIWKGLAEMAVKNLKKGQLVCIRARLENNNYINKDGKKVYDTKIVGEKLLYCDTYNRSKPAIEDEKELEEETE